MRSNSYKGFKVKVTTRFKQQGNRIRAEVGVKFSIEVRIQFRKKRPASGLRVDRGFRMRVKVRG